VAFEPDAQEVPGFALLEIRPRIDVKERGDDGVVARDLDLEDQRSTARRAVIGIVSARVAPGSA
jgi:hypothetical protein